MRIITNPHLIDALREVHPVRIAVAYVGIDWCSYIDKHALAEIILSPTIGSNPRAIREIVESLGWKNVHFLDELHAKVYIGEHKAAFGSFNLSKNGINETGLEELGVLTDDKTDVTNLNVEFVRLRKLALSSYQAESKKKKRLEELQAERNRAIAEGILRNDTPTCELIAYTPVSENELYVMWYRDVVVKFNYEELMAQDRELEEKNFNNVVNFYTTVLEEDNIKPDTWILLWQAKQDGMPMSMRHLQWMYVHQVVPQSVIDEPYTKIVLERKDKKRPTEPFDIKSKDVQDAIKSVLRKTEFSAFREQGIEPWSALACNSKILEFVNAAKYAVKKDG